MSEHQIDESGRVVAAWHHERPDLDISPMLVFSRLSRLSRYFDFQRRRAFAEHGLEPWEFDVLASLRRAGEPYTATPGVLMNDMLVSSGAMTNRIDRLETKGLVKRCPSPEDRRAVLVQLTDAGMLSVDAALESLLEVESGLLGQLPPSQRTALADLLQPLLRVLETAEDEKRG